MTATRRILFATPYPAGTAASQRFRFEHYFDALRARGFQIECASFWDERGWDVLYQPGKRWAKFRALVRGFRRRLSMLRVARDYDVVFIHRELTPVGPPLFEWALHRRGVGFVYDFDDAIWLKNASSANPLAGALRFYRKVGMTCRWARAVSCGNEFLAAFARKYNDNVHVNPTVVDTAVHRPAGEAAGDGPPCIGWTGTHSTLSDLESIADVLHSLAARVAFRLVVIADRAPAVELPNAEFVPWRRESEVADLQRIDIGLMPLPDTDWARGKCGFKLIQYHALAIPAVASPVGVNPDVVVDGESGFLCSNAEAWLHALTALVEDPQLRARMGARGRDRVVEAYSVASNTERFVATLD